LGHYHNQTSFLAHIYIYEIIHLYFIRLLIDYEYLRTNNTITTHDLLISSSQHSTTRAWKPPGPRGYLQNAVFILAKPDFVVPFVERLSFFAFAGNRQGCRRKRESRVHPEDTLAPAPGLLCLLSGSGTSMRAVELPNDDPAIIECILRWLLKHGQIAGIPANLEINVRQKSETRYALELTRLYACAVKYNVEGLANDIVDAFIIHSSVRLVAPCTITALTQAGLSQSDLRKYLLTRLAYDLVIAGKNFERSTPTGASWDVYCFQNPGLEAEIRSFDPADTVDLFRHCSMVYGSGLSGVGNKTAYKDRCTWHRHTFTKACTSSCLKNIFKFKPNSKPPMELVINRPQLTTTATPDRSSESEPTDVNSVYAPPPYHSSAS